MTFAGEEEGNSLAGCQTTGAQNQRRCPDEAEWGALGFPEKRASSTRHKTRDTGGEKTNSATAPFSEKHKKNRCARNPMVFTERGEFEERKGGSAQRVSL